MTCLCGWVVSKIHLSTLILTCLWTSKRVLTKSLNLIPAQKQCCEIMSHAGSWHHCYGKMMSFCSHWLDHHRIGPLIKTHCPKNCRISSLNGDSQRACNNTYTTLAFSVAVGGAPGLLPLNHFLVALRKERWMPLREVSWSLRVRNMRSPHGMRPRTMNSWMKIRSRSWSLKVRHDPCWGLLLDLLTGTCNRKTSVEYNLSYWTTAL